ncbi:MAG: hypothetical protein HC794_01015 [Nitrospiraceae bacterium]|nr:hypothetical protein [Nitrospiraceae bacterium]
MPVALGDASRRAGVRPDGQSVGSGNAVVEHRAGEQGQPLHFTAVSNVAATFDFRSSGGIGGQLFETSGPVFARNFYMFNLGASMAESPTVSIIPVQGEDFTKRILTPMDETKFDFLVAQGVEPAIVLRLMGARVGRRIGRQTDVFSQSAAQA